MGKRARNEGMDRIKRTEEREEFCALLEQLMREQNVSAERLSEGLCSVSMMTRIRKGERTPAKMMRDRLLGRLGISDERCEHFLNPEDYARWEERYRILRHIACGETVRARELLAGYREEPGSANPVEQQFCHAMEIQLLLYEGSKGEELATRLEEAVKLTVPDIDVKSVEDLALSLEELNLILEYEKYVHPERLARRCTELLKYMDDSAFDAHCRAKIYPKAARYFYEASTNEANRDYPGLLRTVNRGIENLRSTQRTYWLWELLEAREGLLAEWTDLLREKGEGNKVDALGGLVRETQEWKRVFEQLCGTYGIRLPMDNFCYLYLQQEVCCINEVIRRRRRMLGMTRKQLVAGICEEKAMVRLENENAKTQMPIVRQLFERLNLAGELRRKDIVTSSREALEILQKLVKHTNNCEVEQEKRLLLDLEQYLDMGIPLNRQFVKKEYAILQWEQDKADGNGEKALKMMREALECTINFEKIEQSGIWYLTKGEILCLHNMAKYAGVDKVSCYLEILLKICKEYEQRGEVDAHVNIYVLIMASASNAFGNMGMYDESDLFAQKAIIQSLRCRKLSLVSYCLNCLSWNNLQRQEKGIPINGVFNRKADLENCIVISEFCRDTFHVGNLRRRLRKLEENS